MSWELLQGDVLDRLAEIETGTVQCCVTSPPYWGLRDYGVDGQIGLEETPNEYVTKMVQVFREAKRVLRDDGTLWLNLGDTYAANRGCQIGLKPKDLIGIPWRVAFALQADGWWLRSDIIWAKPNPMPESVTDRPTRAHEYIFLLSKSAQYYYDNEAIKEKAVSGTDVGILRSKKQATCNHPSILKRQKENIDSRTAGDGNRNKRSVWTVATQPYPEAHFATFPPKLIEPCILAGTSPKACEKCGAPWERVVEKTKYKPAEGKRFVDKSRGDKTRKLSGADYNKAVRVIGETWQPTCTCKNSGKGRCIVLDPFAGSGTTLWVAEHYGRDSIGIELSPEYCELINKRMSNRQMTLFERGADL